MTNPPRHARTLDTAVRRWSNLWIGAVTTFGVSGLLQWVVLPPGGTLAEIAKGVEIAAIVVGICGLFRWAVLFERQKSSDGKKPHDA
jgi:hypothetical protein